MLKEKHQYASIIFGTFAVTIFGTPRNFDFNDIKKKNAEPQDKHLLCFIISLSHDGDPGNILLLLSLGPMF